MLYTLDQGWVLRAPMEPTTPDVRRLIDKYKGEHEFKGHTFFGLPVFYFETPPPNDIMRGIKWIELYKEC